MLRYLDKNIVWWWCAALGSKQLTQKWISPRDDSIRAASQQASYLVLDCESKSVHDMGNLFLTHKSHKRLRSRTCYDVANKLKSLATSLNHYVCKWWIFFLLGDKVISVAPAVFSYRIGNFRFQQSCDFVVRKINFHWSQRKTCKIKKIPRTMSPNQQSSSVLFGGKSFKRIFTFLFRWALLAAV